MADFITQAVENIDSQIATLNEEASKLQAARAALVDVSSPSNSGSTAPAKPAASKPKTRGPGRPKGSRSSTRAAQAAEVVQANPGVKIPAIADALKIEANYLYRVMPKLVKDGKVVRNGDGGYSPASA